jgi:hypothetical protein
VAPSQAPKGKQARIDVPLPLISTTTHKTIQWPPASTKSNDVRVAYYPMLGSVPSMESCSSPSSSDSSSSKSFRVSPPPILDLFIFVELPEILKLPKAWVTLQMVPA